MIIIMFFIMYILSIDPGLNNCGISVSNILDKFTVIETILVNNNRKIDKKDLEVLYGSRTIKILTILDSLERLYTKYKDITTIVIEMPFYNSLTPIAYSSLLEVIFAIKYMFVLKYNLQLKLVEPLLIKKLFANKHLASKEAIKYSLIQKTDNNDIVLNYDINTLSEHEIDAIAIGFVYYLELKEVNNV